MKVAQFGHWAIAHWEAIVWQSLKQSITLCSIAKATYIELGIYLRQLRNGQITTDTTGIETNEDGGSVDLSPVPRRVPFHGKC